jgi:methane/ammonia monooxygenase subunit B
MIIPSMKTLRGISMIVTVLLGAQTASAHGERAQEPFLRTRSIQFYDVQFDKTQVKVNEQFTVTGKAHFSEQWADAVAQPDVAYLSASSPGPVVVRVSSDLNGVPARQSFSKLELGRDYAFTLVLEARTPGRYHIHPTIAVKGSGALVGPGQWIEISGSGANFAYPVTTMTGLKIDNLETVGVAHAVKWHVVWFVLGAFWLIFWLARPLLLPRWLTLLKGREDLLVTRVDLATGIGLGAIVVALIFGGYAWTVSDYPYNVPLQSGTVRVDPLPLGPHGAVIKTLDATYDVPGRSMRIRLSISNTGPTPLTIGEFSTANIRFVNLQSPDAMNHVDRSYPKDLVPRGGLSISDPSPIQPGETREVRIDATDAAWELERLVSFLTDVDSKFGALLFLYSSDGERNMVEIGGPILPVFTRLKSAMPIQSQLTMPSTMESDAGRKLARYSVAANL